MKPVRISIVSAPLGAPWTNGSKVLARDIATGMAEQGRSIAVLATPDARLDGVRAVKVGPSRLQWLTRAAMIRADLVHAIFAPTLFNAFALRALVRGRPSVQTLASMPDAQTSLRDVVFADRIVVLSQGAEQRALAQGIAASRLVRIRPTVRPPEKPTELRVAAEAKRVGLPSDALRIAFVGDLEHGDGARLMIDACASSLRHQVVLVMATRAKTDAARAHMAALQARANARGVSLRWAGTSPDIHALLVACDVIALPTTSLFAKVDHPLVLLEAMHLGVPVIVTQGTTAYELAEEGGAVGVEHDVEALRAQLELMLAPAVRRVASMHGLSFAQRELNTDAMARAYGAVYDALLG